MQKCRSLTTPSLIIAFAIGAAALSAQPANASDRFSEAWAVGLARFESTLERTWFRLSLGSQPIHPAEGAVPIPGGKEGAVPVPGGKEGAVPVPGGGISNTLPTRPAAPGADRDRSY